MGTYAKFKSRIQLEENLFEITHSIYNNGSCQCFKDCDCYSKRGEYLYDDIKYSNGIILRENGKERIYSSKIGCKTSLEAYQNKNIYKTQ